MGHWVTGVSVVTAQPEGGAPCGLTVNSFCSVSLNPLIVLICVEKNADSHNCIGGSGFFAVNVLDSMQETIARRFASWDVAEKFRGLAYRTEVSGAPILGIALALLGWKDAADYTAGSPLVSYGE